MPEFFDGSSFTLEECFEEQFSVHRESESHRNYKSVTENYSVYDDWWENTRQVFNGCFNIASESGYACSVLSHKEGYTYGGYQRQFLANPAAFKSFDIWALYHTIKNVELDFIDRCKTPRNEEALTAKLTEVISAQAEKIQNKYEKHLCITNSRLNISEVELQVQNREKGIGADIGFLLEWKDEKGNLKICPIILQAKRIASEIADISQSNKTEGFQFYKLQKSKANPVYMFYHCDTQSTLEKPRVITVKKLDKINVTGEPKKTNAVEDVLSLSTFFLEIMSDANKYTIVTDRAKALASILNTVSQSELYGVFSFSIDAESALKYSEAYERYVTYIKDRNNENSSFEP
jgi:hypothetical protein